MGKKAANLIIRCIKTAIEEGTEIYLESNGDACRGVPLAIDGECVELKCQWLDHETDTYVIGRCIMYLDTIERCWYDRQDWTNERLDRLTQDADFPFDDNGALA